ncbi:VOC family protein [Micromonospora sp. LH3U1]|uniref:VOC family protein n=1 Tax=Micromonospora sp. LH3U1 TaxID=3018339 RepID=UPI002349899F|nr:VOC family protein [Micromonospora sp. LH3U1]WCN81761.1 VOC family protein [Micromonospora sp. LH3U1]
MPPTPAYGKICYLEIPATDIAASAAFYQQVFDWNIRKRSGDETRVSFDDGLGEVSGAWVLDRPPSREPGLLVYLQVDDVDAAVQKVEAAGGVIVQPVGADEGELTARFSDPAGNVFGLYQEPPEEN